MTLRGALSTGLVVGAVLWSAAAPAQQEATPRCTPKDKAAAAPARVEGQVTKLDPAAGRVTVMATDGKVHEFDVPRETLESLKVGDHLSAKLRFC